MCIRDSCKTKIPIPEGLRIWNSRPYFKENPEEAIRRLADLKNDPSEYVRKSVGNALRDISKKHGALVGAVSYTHLEEEKLCCL